MDPILNIIFGALFMPPPHFNIPPSSHLDMVRIAAGQKKKRVIFYLSICSLFLQLNNLIITF